MATRIYGRSDDLLEFEGDIRNEVDCYDTDLKVTLDDGTVLKTHYGKLINGVDEGIWSIELLKEGALFNSLDICTDSEAEIYSDIAHFCDGLKLAKVEKYV